jgi:hypothetical protein
VHPENESSWRREEGGLRGVIPGLLQPRGTSGATRGVQGRGPGLGQAVWSDKAWDLAGAAVELSQSLR